VSKALNLKNITSIQFDFTILISSLFLFSLEIFQSSEHIKHLRQNLDILRDTSKPWVFRIQG